MHLDESYANTNRTQITIKTYKSQSFTEIKFISLTNKDRLQLVMKFKVMKEQQFDSAKMMPFRWLTFIYQYQVKDMQQKQQLNQINKNLRVGYID